MQIRDYQVDKIDENTEKLSTESKKKERERALIPSETNESK